MSEQNNLFQIYKIKCQTQANANACQKCVSPTPSVRMC